MSLKISGALSEYKLQEMADINCGKFSIRIKQAAVHNEKFRAAVTTRALKAKRKSLVPSKGAITGSYEEDVRLFCDEVIAGWGEHEVDGQTVPHPMLDDDGQVIEPTKENFFEIFTSTSNGKVLFGKLMTAAMDDDTFVLSETDMGKLLQVLTVTLEVGIPINELLKQLAQQKRGMPPHIADMLEVREGWMDFYLNAFWDLTTCRAVGLSAGPIPWRDIEAYAARYGIEDEDYEIFKTVIRKLDQRYMEHGRTS